MPPTLILIRHAEAQHNATSNWDLRDPGLTDLGFQQSRQLGEALQKTLPGRLDVDLVLVSPMRRTLQTAIEALSWLFQPSATLESSSDSVTPTSDPSPSPAPRRVPIMAHAGWQETTDNPCDIGSSIAEIACEFPSVDFSAVDPVYPDKTSELGKAYAFTQEAILARAQTVLAELHKRPESVVLVVSHSSFLSKAVCGSMFGNADYRIFSFENDTDKAELASKLWPPAEVVDGLQPMQYRLCEWDETRSNNGGMGWSYEESRKIGVKLPGGSTDACE